MPTRNISLTVEQDAFLDAVLESGEYESASEAMPALQLRREEDRLKLERLRLAIAQGLDDLEKGRYVDLADDELEDYLDRLSAS